MEKPIIFNAEMVKAILDGRKSMTRRIIKPQPSKERKFVGYSTDLGYPESTNYFWAGFGIGNKSPAYFKCPYKIGMRLWVRETFAYITDYDGQIIFEDRKALYRATDNDWLVDRWRPSIFMPRWASRINLETINIRVERVQNITEADAILEGCEGIECLDCDENILAHIDGELCWNLRPVDQFENLWDSINKKRGYGWSENPWCWCVSFKKVRP